MQQVDQWARWLLGRRDGDDPDVLARRLPYFEEMRDRVLDAAEIEPGDTVLDLGTGNGIIAFGALDRVGADGKVIFSDVSEDLLAECRRLAEETKAIARCDFVRASAEALNPIADGSV